jgi:hypothetical protein
MKKVNARVKEKYGGNRTGSVQESFVKNKTKFVRILWDGDADIDERHYTSKSVVNIHNKHAEKTVAEVRPVISLKKSEDHVDIEKLFDLTQVSSMVAQINLKQTSQSVRSMISEDDINMCTKTILEVKLNKAMTLLKELVTFYDSAIDSADRNGDIAQGAKLKAELVAFQKSDGYIAAVQLGDESLIESSSALIDVITEQVIAQQIKIRLCKTHAKKKTAISTNLSDIDLLNNQSSISKSKAALKLAPGTAGLDDHESEADIPFDANNPDTFPINIDARLYEVSKGYYFLF